MIDDNSWAVEIRLQMPHIRRNHNQWNLLLWRASITTLLLSSVYATSLASSSFCNIDPSP